MPNSIKNMLNSIKFSHISQIIHYNSLNSFARCVSSKRMVVGNRACLEVIGKDTLKFLQGICTTDMSKKLEGVQATAFLSVKGRVMADAFIYPHVGQDKKGDDVDAVLIELDKATLPQIQQMMKVYKLRSKVTIGSIGPVSVTLHVPESTLEPGGDNSEDAMVQAALESEREHSGDILGRGWDPRVPGFGVRVLSSSSSRRSSSNSEVCDIDYTSYRAACGVSEGVETVGGIPLESNMDLLTHIDFRKGCYVGQELTARTKFKGVVRKRVVPFTFTTTVDEAGGQVACQAGDKVYVQTDDSSDEKTVGVVTCAPPRCGAAGLVLLRLAALRDAGASFRIKASAAAEEGEGEAKEGEEDPVIVPYIPAWWPGEDPITEKPLF